MTEKQADDEGSGLDANKATDRSILWKVLLINLGQCIAGVAVGLVASSTAVIAAALDNLADASVYGVSLYAVGRSATIKVRAARLSGWLLIGLAVLMWWGTNVPDLVLGLVVSGIAANGGREILSEASEAADHDDEHKP